jgi:phosphatidylserine/phosphatidylglycerophosphate/cardiolipin synthase-like enzyme
MAWKRLAYEWLIVIKGIWLKSDNPNEPYIMVIGSSNYGKRSEMLDLECQCYLFTIDKELQTRIESVNSSMKATDFLESRVSV